MSRAITFTLDGLSTLACYVFVGLCALFMALILLPSWLLGGVDKGEPDPFDVAPTRGEIIAMVIVAAIAVLASATWPMWVGA